MEVGHFEMILLPKRIPTPIIPQSTWQQKAFIGKQRVEFYTEYIENLGGFIFYLSKFTLLECLK